ncbi:MAG: DUF255 domain-containing protein [Halobacteriota archaeon]
MSDPTRVQWRPWGADAFAEAAETNTPVLLALTATWSTECHEMDARTFGEPRIAAHVNDDFVPIRVDVDRHPRVRERYNVGGFPTVAFCTPAGKLLTGTTYLGPDGFRQVLERVRDLWRQKGPDAGRIPRALADEPTPRAALDDRIDEHLTGQLTAQFDPEFAGWGTDAKFPLARTIEFALKRERELAVRTLDAIARNLFDDVAGGFFRLATERDWSGVRYEKTIDENAALLRAFANGYLYTGDETYREVADRTIAFLTDDLWTGVAVGGSIGPGQGAAYYGRDADGRAELTAPRRDVTVFAGGNALVADALLTYHSYTDDQRAAEYADRIVTAIETDLLEGDVVRRFDTGEETGEALVLEDTARVLGAWTRAHQVLGDSERLDRARAVADAAIDELFVDGSFLDGPQSGPGLLDRPLRPLEGTIEMADALVELSILTGEESYRATAREAVEAFAGAWDRMGVQVAGYGSIVSRLEGAPLVFEIGGDAGCDLHRAACRVADHEKVAIPAVPSVGAGEAKIRGSERDRRATTPEELMQLVAERSE